MNEINFTKLSRQWHDTVSHIADEKLRLKFYEVTCNFFFGKESILEDTDEDFEWYAVRYALSAGCKGIVD